MTAALPIDRVQSTPPRFRHWAPVLSVLLHLAVLAAFIDFPLPKPPPPEPPALSVDIIPEPPAMPPPRPTESAPDKPKMPDAAPKVVPQLTEGALAEKSTPVTERGPQSAGGLGGAPKKPTKIEPPTQNERDFILSRVLRHWKPPAQLRAFEKADISLAVQVMPDGRFGDIYDARRPWNPADVFDGYAALNPQSVQRRTIDAVYAAVRKAQPMDLPAKLKAKAPFSVRLDFRFKDAKR